MFRLILDTFEQGGFVMWLILGVSLVVWFLGLQKLYQLWCLNRARGQFLCGFDLFINGKIDVVTGQKNYDLLVSKLSRYDTVTPGIFKGLFREFLIATMSITNQGIESMAVCVSVAPLLGLLGTVVGMIETFTVITKFGVGNPALTAEGISVALLTTEAGLIVAFPGLLLYTFVNNRKLKLQRVLLSDGESLLKRIRGTGQG